MTVPRRVELALSLGLILIGGLAFREFRRAQVAIREKIALEDTETSFFEAMNRADGISRDMRELSEEVHSHG